MLRPGMQMYGQPPFLIVQLTVRFVPMNVDAASNGKLTAFIHFFCTSQCMKKSKNKSTHVSMYVHMCIVGMCMYVYACVCVWAVCVYVCVCVCVCM